MVEDDHISNNWIEGVALDRGFVQPVITAREYLPGYQHDDAVRLWKSFIDIAEQWKQQHGFVETRNGRGGLLSSLPFSAREPWMCAGKEVQDPVDLLTRKLGGFEPYDQLERCHGLLAILAVICLAHAAEAPNTHLNLRGRTAYKAYEKLRSREALVEGAKLTADLMGPTYKRGKLFRPGRLKGAEDSLGKWLDDYARNYPNATGDEVVSALLRDPRTERSDTAETLYFDGKRRIFKTIKERWYKIRQKRS